MRKELFILLAAVIVSGCTGSSYSQDSFTELPQTVSGLQKSYSSTSSGQGTLKAAKSVRYGSENSSIDVQFILRSEESGQKRLRAFTDQDLPNRTEIDLGGKKAALFTEEETQGNSTVYSWSCAWKNGNAAVKVDSDPGIGQQEVRSVCQTAVSSLN